MKKLVCEKYINTNPYKAILVDEEGNRYFFKEENDEGTFRELLSQEIALLLGIDHITYTPYAFDGVKGVISPYFMDEKHHYLTGKKLISDYIHDTKVTNPDLLYDKTDEDGTIKLKSYQDLYLAWQAMEEKFKEYPEYQEQIKEFMNKLINMMIFDILTLTPDRHGDNWIIEYDDTSFRLCPVFDNNAAFRFHFTSKLNTTQENITNDWALKLLLNESDVSVYERFTSSYNLVNPDNISVIIDNTIKKYNFNISEESRKKIINYFTRNYRSLEEVINSQTKYEDIKTPEELLKFMEENIVYGFISKSGKKYTDQYSKEYKDNWYDEGTVQTGKEVLNTKVGTCFDQVEFERLWFKEHNYKFRTIFMWYAIPEENPFPTHSFLVYENNNKFYWFEHSDTPNKGIYEFDTLEELIEHVKRTSLNYVIRIGIGKEEDYDLLVYYEYEEIEKSLSIPEYLEHVIKYEEENEKNY